MLIKIYTIVLNFFSPGTKVLFDPLPSDVIICGDREQASAHNPLLPNMISPYFNT